MALTPRICTRFTSLSRVLNSNMPRTFHNRSGDQSFRLKWTLMRSFRQVVLRHSRKLGLVAAVGLIPSVHAWGWGGGDTKDTNAKVVEQKLPSTEDQVIATADDLYSQNAIIHLYELLGKHKDSNNDEILWRLARAACDKAKMSQDAEQKKALMYEAFEVIKRALELNDKNYACHKWYGILLDYTGEFEGTKQRISNAFTIKEAFLRAIELNPKDATTIYSLGYWCFLFAEMPWYQRKVASVIFTSPPTSTYEEAVKYFLQAEKMDPNFYSMNLMMLGKTFLRLDNQKMALLYLTRARDYAVKTEDDKQAHTEAEELLKGMGIQSK